MDGDLPAKDRLPISADHPNSIFSLFAKTHRLNVSEEATSVCSRDLCKDTRLDEPYGDRISSMSEDLGLVWLHVVSPPGIEEDLDSVSENWGDFGGGGRRRQRQQLGGSGKTANTRSNLAGGRRARFEEWVANIKNGPPAEPELQAHADAPRALAVHARRAAATGASRTTWSRACPTRPTTTRASSTCCSSATSCRPASPTCSSRSSGATSSRRGSGTTR